MIPDAAQVIREQAQKATELRIKRAAEYLQMRCPSILFSCTWRQPGGAKVLLRVESPGVLKVFDYKTGELLGQSLPGRFDVAAPT